MINNIKIQNLYTYLLEIYRHFILFILVSGVILLENYRKFVRYMPILLENCKKFIKYMPILYGNLIDLYYDFYHWLNWAVREAMRIYHDDILAVFYRKHFMVLSNVFYKDRQHFYSLFDLTIPSEIKENKFKYNWLIFKRIIKIYFFINLIALHPLWLIKIILTILFKHFLRYIFMYLDIIFCDLLTCIVDITWLYWPIKNKIKYYTLLLPYYIIPNYIKWLFSLEGVKAILYIIFIFIDHRLWDIYVGYYPWYLTKKIQIQRLRIKIKQFYTRSVKRYMYMKKFIRVHIRYFSFIIRNIYYNYIKILLCHPDIFADLIRNIIKCIIKTYMNLFYIEIKYGFKSIYRFITRIHKHIWILCLAVVIFILESIINLFLYICDVLYWIDLKFFAFAFHNIDTLLKKMNAWCIHIIFLVDNFWIYLDIYKIKIKDQIIIKKSNLYFYFINKIKILILAFIKLIKYFNIDILLIKLVNYINILLSTKLMIKIYYIFKRKLNKRRYKKIYKYIISTKIFNIYKYIYDIFINIIKDCNI